MPRTPAVRIFAPQRGQISFSRTFRKSRTFTSIGSSRPATSATAARITLTIASWRRTASSCESERHQVFGWMPRLEQDLVGVGVADAVEGLLVEQEHAHLVATVPQQAHEALAR